MIVRAENEKPPSAVAAPPPAAISSEQRDWLVLSSDPSTRDLVLGAVHRVGHSGHAASARASPAIAVATSRYRFSFIDLVHPGGRLADLDHWTALLRLHGSRLVVRGGDDDLDDERWARNASASLYLPGKLAEGRLKHLLENLSC